MTSLPDPQEMIKILTQALSQFAAGAKTIADHEIRQQAMMIAAEWEKALPELATVYPQAVREIEDHVAKGEQAAAQLRKEATRLQAYAEQYEADLLKAATPPAPAVEVPLPPVPPPPPAPRPVPAPAPAVPGSDEGSIWRDDKFLATETEKDYSGAASQDSRLDELVIEDEAESASKAKQPPPPSNANDPKPATPRPHTDKGKDMWDPGLTEL